MSTVILCTIAYLAGSIPFGLLFTRMAGKGDIRAIGSGNIGATNVLRTGSKKLALATLFADGFKGFLPVYLAGQAAGLVAIGTVLGHMFPVWLRFNGGKGVATGFGALLGLSGALGALGLCIWLTMAKVSRYSSLSALTAFAIMPLLFWWQCPNFGPFVLVISALVFWRHKTNIQRLMRGEEGRIGEK